MLKFACLPAPLPQRWRHQPVSPNDGGEGAHVVAAIGNMVMSSFGRFISLGPRPRLPTPSSLLNELIAVLSGLLGAVLKIVLDHTIIGRIRVRLPVLARVLALDVLVVVVLARVLPRVLAFGLVQETELKSANAGTSTY